MSERRHAGFAPVELTVNGERAVVAAGATTTLVETLREALGLKGTHVGCETARCGACTVALDGEPVKACTVLTRQVTGRCVDTVEGLASGGDLDPLQASFRKHHALQCGFCTPGMLMAARGLLARDPNPDEASIREALKGNLCRCTGYEPIVRAIQAIGDGSEGPSEPARQPSRPAQVGERVERVEDARFLTGRGRYLADIDLPGQLHAAFVRSTVAHGRLITVDTSAAEAMNGVVAVLTGEDVAADGLGLLGCSWVVHSRDGSPMRGGERPLLARDRVRHVGDALALVVARDARTARRAADAVVVEYEGLRSTVDATKAPDGETLHPEAPDNVCFDWQFGDEAGADRALSDAAHIVSLKLVNNRVIAAPLETRAALAQVDPVTDEATLYTTSQNSHLARKVICETLGFVSDHTLRVVSPDLGGSFGSKIFIYPEECAVLWASKRLGRPIKWVAGRREAFQSDAHGRDHHTRAQLALDADLRFTALKVETTANLGAYLSSFAAYVPTFLYGTMLAGPYKTPIVSCAVRGVFTNTPPVDAYRGAGRPEATYLLETLVDHAARELGVGAVELRRRNFIRRADFPYQTPVALEYDDGDYEAHLGAALSMADREGFAARREASRAKGKLRGFGLSCYVEACGIAPSAVAGALGAKIGLWESALVRMTPAGHCEVFTGSHSHGQGHETSFAQLVSDRLGLPMDAIKIRHGDTLGSPVGMGTYGSRSLAVGGSAIVRALDAVHDKAATIAAHLLGTQDQRPAFDGGVFRHDDREIALRDVIEAAYLAHDLPEGMEPGLEATAFHDPENFTYPSGTYVCEVEIDPAIGAVSIERFVAVDDFGQVVNPLIVEGQVRGGIAQGIGQALFESIAFDDATGQPLSE
ncbi:MAG: molybdopterin-dependent oxidoreductase, partial [Devosiaceae bacterium]|nr:molybdopterin-dependent oxidoreductase [Devosiaceae bacterium MH13]